MHIDPRYQNVKLLQAQENQYQEALDKARELLVVRDELLTKYNNLPQSDLERLNRVVPDKVNGVKLVTDINEIAGKYNIPIKSIKVSEELIDNSNQIVDPVAAKPFLTTSIDFKFSAEYADLVSFLKDLEKSLQVVDVRSVSFGALTEKSGQYDYDIAIHTYWLKPIAAN